jgi:Ca-activated chloride channel family protein
MSADDQGPVGDDGASGVPAADAQASGERGDHDGNPGAGPGEPADHGDALARLAADLAVSTADGGENTAMLALEERLRRSLPPAPERLDGARRVALLGAAGRQAPVGFVSRHRRVLVLAMSLAAVVLVMVTTMAELRPVRESAWRSRLSPDVAASSLSRDDYGEDGKADAAPAFPAAAPAAPSENPPVRISNISQQYPPRTVVDQVQDPNQALLSLQKDAAPAADVAAEAIQDMVQQAPSDNSDTRDMAVAADSDMGGAGAFMSADGGGRKVRHVHRGSANAAGPAVDALTAQADDPSLAKKDNDSAANQNTWMANAGDGTYSPDAQDKLTSGPADNHSDQATNLKGVAAKEESERILTEDLPGLPVAQLSKVPQAPPPSLDGQRAQDVAKRLEGQPFETGRDQTATISPPTTVANDWPTVPAATTGGLHDDDQPASTPGQASNDFRNTGIAGHAGGKVAKVVVNWAPTNGPVGGSAATTEPDDLDDGNRAVTAFAALNSATQTLGPGERSARQLAALMGDHVDAMSNGSIDRDGMNGVNRRIRDRQDAGAPMDTRDSDRLLRQDATDSATAASVAIASHVQQNPVDFATALANPVAPVQGTLGAVIDGLSANAFANLAVPISNRLDPAISARTVDLGTDAAQSPAPLGLALLNLARANQAQLRLDGGALAIVPARDCLDPTENFGLEPAAFLAAFGTSPMQAVARAPKQTFALAADTASWELTRARLRTGHLPDPRAVQAEQFINAMPMDYPAPAPPAAFALYAEAGPSLFAAGPAAARTDLVAVGAVARAAAPDERRPLHLTVAVDCSGSMAKAGGLDRVVIGLHELVTHLRAGDEVAIVAFADRARVVLPPTAGTDHAAILAAIDSLRADGSTDCAEGLQLACQLAVESVAPRTDCRILLATDGATLPADAPAAQAKLAAARAKGIDLVVVGCGDTDVPPAALERLAAAGGGQHRFLGSDAEAVAAFSGPLLPEHLAVLGRDAKVQVTWNAARVAHARLIGWEARRLKNEDFRNDSVAAGTVAHDEQVTALFEVILVDGGTGPLGSAVVRWKDGADGAVRELSCPLPGSLLVPTPSDRLRTFACAAQFAEILQRGWWSNVRLATWAPLQAQIARLPRDQATLELRSLVDRAQRIDNGP